jgi:hypothetical protein
MRKMNKAIFLSAGVFALTLSSCETDDLYIEDFLNNTNGHADGDADGDADADADGDADTDADGDADTDADTDADSDTDGDGGFFGVDLLMVVDNSASMAEEQSILATSLYNLINALVSPTSSSPYAPVENVRVAVVSSDMGLQYGESGLTSDSSDLPTCYSTGDDGRFQTDLLQSVTIASNVISCDPDGEQCPNADWTCEAGLCKAPGGAQNAVVGCAPLATVPWAETTESVPNRYLVNNVSCMAELGTGGCGIEQQLQAGVKAVTRPDQSAFLKEDHLLSVIVVSDEEDCSIADSGLFQTPEWNDNRYLNTACNFPESNETNYLFNADYFHDKLVEAKGGRSDAVVFAAIVGVPSIDATCQGNGNQIGGCIADPAMQLVPQEFHDDLNDVNYTHFSPACTRVDSTGTPVTTARPGRRFVETAQQFGSEGYVFSICNADWSPAMAAVSSAIVQRILPAAK